MIRSARFRAAMVRGRAALVAVALLGAAAFVAALPVAHVHAQAPNAQLGPQELMDDVSKRMLAALDQNRAAIRKDPSRVYPIVNDILLPHFDTDYAAQLVLAQHWRTATPEQRKRFVSALYNALLRTYGGALTDFTADRLKLLPFRGDPTATQATVRSVVTRANGQEVPVDYRLRKTANGWKAFDVVIEGISYVRNYRNDLGAEVSQRGLDAVIARLEKDGIDLDAAPAAKPAAARAR
ncbi:MAG: ABC transporter substrate-binding protein [Steroidobacteraceae bacterium]|nr:ABC transporter substrate-binding protein [Steroidobacteraceae bacterium]